MTTNTVNEGTPDISADTACANACYEGLNRCDRIPTFSEADTADLDVEQKSKCECPMWCVPCRSPAPAPEVSLSSAFLSVTFNWKLTVEDTWGDDSWSDEMWRSFVIEGKWRINKFGDFVEELSDVEPGPTLIQNRACAEAVISRFLGEPVRLGTYDAAELKFVYRALCYEPKKIYVSKDGNTLVLVGGTTDNELTVFGRSTSSINDAALQVTTYLEKLKKKLNDENAGSIQNYKHVELSVKLFGGSKARQCILKSVKSNSKERKSKGSEIIVLADAEDALSFVLRLRYNLEKLFPGNLGNFEHKLLQEYACDLHQVYKRYEQPTNRSKPVDLENNNDESEDSVTGLDNNEKPMKSNTSYALACYEALQRCRLIPTCGERGGWKRTRGYPCGCPHWCIPFRSCRHYPPRKCFMYSAFVSVTLPWNQTVEKTSYDSDDSCSPTKVTKHSVQERIPKDRFEQYIEAALDDDPGQATLIGNRACIEAICSRFFGESIGFNDAGPKKTSVSYVFLSREPEKIHVSKDGNALVMIGRFPSELTIIGRSTASIIHAAIVTGKYLDKLKAKLSEEKVLVDDNFYVELGVKLFGGSKVRKCIMEAVNAKGSEILLTHANGVVDNSCVFNLRARHSVYIPMENEETQEDAENILMVRYATDMHFVYHHLC